MLYLVRLKQSTMNYKGYELRTTNNGNGKMTVAYLNNEPAYASCTEHETDIDSETKCKMKIDGTRPSHKGNLNFIMPLKSKA